MEIPLKFYQKYDDLSKEEIRVYLCLCEELLLPEDLQGREFVCDRTKKELAEVTGMSASEVRLTLTSLAKKGLIKLHGRKIVLIVRNSGSKSRK